MSVGGSRILVQNQHESVSGSDVLRRSSNMFRERKQNVKTKSWDLTCILQQGGSRITAR